MPLDYGPTRQMRDAVDAMRAHAVGDKVGLVMRWNKRNDMIWTIYSEFMNRQDDLNIPPQARNRFERWNETAPHVFEQAPQSPQIGCHAEEIMIVNWSWYEETFRARADGVAERAPWAILPPNPAFVLREVDLVLSKSPCHGPGGSQPLRHGGVTYGTGCATKLHAFCSTGAMRNLTWRIFYAALPPEKRETRFEPRVQPQNLSAKARRNWPREEENRMTAIRANFVPTGPVGLGWASQGTRSPFAQKIGLALQGIAMLNALPNVTCDPL